ncbi:MAG: hypothetical protein ABIH23_11180, partial [bacterium]
KEFRDDLPWLDILSVDDMFDTHWDEGSGQQLSVFPEHPIAGLRANAYLSDDENRLVLHLVNYNVPINGEDHTPEPARDIPLRIPSPGEKRIVSVRCLGPEAPEPVELAFTEHRLNMERMPPIPRDTNSVDVIVPEIRIYRVVEVLLE